MDFIYLRALLLTVSVKSTYLKSVKDFDVKRILVLTFTCLL